VSDPSVGWVAVEVSEEFPELRLVELSVQARPGRSPRSVRDRLKHLSNRFRGAQAVAQRPDADRTPAEAAMLARLVRGGFRSENLLDDALLIALLETGVPIWALDEGQVDGTLGVRLAGAGERLGRAAEAPPVPAGRLVVADGRSPLAILFGELAPRHGVTADTRAMRLFSVQVAGVPSIHVDEALWQCSDILLEGIRH
jgi:DNA/RNA-binding domain of Phe-tRNA-synthetase-like protein